MSDLVPLRLRRAPDGGSSSLSSSGSGSGDPGVGVARPSGKLHHVYIETYGCQMNVADTEMVLGLLQGAGYGRTDDPEAADLILLNTCAVREKAEEKVYARASMLAHHRARPGVVLGITGCMAEHLKSEIQTQAPYVDLVVGPDGYRRLLDHVERARAGDKIEDTQLDRFETYEGLDPARDMGAGSDRAPSGASGHITIQRGCDKFCTFCVVPYTRGRERGTPPREVLRQARALAAAGYKEVQLLGQTVNSYRHQETGFAELLRAVATVGGLERIRFTSPYPLDFSPAVIAAIAETPQICKHVHLPLQTASDPVLERMRRGYRYEDFRRLVSELRAAMPEVAITTDLLVGFCDESEEEFQELLQAQAELRFDSAFMFAYSERQGTFAARKLADNVPEPVKRRRLAQVIALQKQITSEIMSAQIGKRDRVLIEHVSKRSAQELLGRTGSYRAVVVPAGPGVAIGALVDVVIERATSATLFARPLAP